MGKQKTPASGHFEIAGSRIAPGTRELVSIPVSQLAAHLPITLPVHVVNGARPGPVLFVCAAIHGDELNGIEIIRQLVRLLVPEQMAGTVLGVPIVNAYGFMVHSRYLPDRRDLNRFFPGGPDGSLASRLANIFMREIVARSNVGIDLHTAAVHRSNLPQIRSAFERPGAMALAKAFAAPIMVRSQERAGSLRLAAREMDVDVLVYEGGEGLRFNDHAISAGVTGVLGVMRHLQMLDDIVGGNSGMDTAGDGGGRELLADASRWVRAPEGGFLRSTHKIGDAVGEGELLGVISSAYQRKETEVRAPTRGIIIGMTTLPTVNMGEALFHIAWTSEQARAASTPAAKPSGALAEPLLDEDEII